MTRRRWSLAALLSAALLPLEAPAQTAPAARPVRIIVPLGAGGAPDVLSRALGQALSERIGQTFIVENRPGANTIIGTDACAKAPADGTTLCVVTSSSLSINPHVYRRLPYDPGRDFEPVVTLAVPDMVLVSSPTVPASNLTELVAHARRNPGKMAYSSFGVGSDTHITLEWLQRSTRTELLHVPFNGFGPMLQAFHAGDVQLMYLSVGNPGVVAQIKSGKMKALAVFASARSPQLGDVPTFDEQRTALGADPFQGHVWFGIVAPAGTPRPLLQYLNLQIIAAQQGPAFREQLATMSMRTRHQSVDEFSAFLRSDRAVWRELLKDGRISLD